MVEAICETYLGGAPMFRQSHETKKEFVDPWEREKEILALPVKGKFYKAVASECFISINTVSTQVRRIYEKLHVYSKSEAVAKAIHQKMVLIFLLTFLANLFHFKTGGDDYSTSFCSLVKHCFT